MLTDIWFSPSADMRSPLWRTVGLPIGGHLTRPRAQAFGLGLGPTEDLGRGDLQADDRPDL